MELLIASIASKLLIASMLFIIVTARPTLHPLPSKRRDVNATLSLTMQSANSDDTQDPPVQHRNESHAPPLRTLGATFHQEMFRYERTRRDTVRVVMISPTPHRARRAATYSNEMFPDWEMGPTQVDEGDCVDKLGFYFCENMLKNECDNSFVRDNCHLSCNLCDKDTHSNSDGRKVVRTGQPNGYHEYGNNGNGNNGIGNNGNGNNGHGSNRNGYDKHDDNLDNKISPTISGQHTTIGQRSTKGYRGSSGQRNNKGQSSNNGHFSNNGDYKSTQGQRNNQRSSSRSSNRGNIRDRNNKRETRNDKRDNRNKKERSNMKLYNSKCYDVRTDCKTYHYIYCHGRDYKIFRELNCRRTCRLC